VKVSRADFLKVCAGALVGAGTGARSPFADAVLYATAPAARFDWTSVSAALFRPHVNTRFTLRTSEGSTQTLVLDRIAERSCGGGFEQLSLVFRSASSGAADGIHTIRHSTLGEFDAFVARIGAPRDRAHFYEICFTRRQGT